MKFYSGFSLTKEEPFFESLLNKSEYSICGFSYGSIAAFNETLKCIEQHKRIDTLQLISPLFFQVESEKFKRLQLMAYKKNTQHYLKEFMNSCFLPYATKTVQREETTLNDLRELLEYKWSLEKLKWIESKGIKIEVYLGEKDKIINSLKAKDFFLEVATITYIKNANHFLQLN